MTSFTALSIKSSILEWYCCWILKDKDALVGVDTKLIYAITHKCLKATSYDISDLHKMTILHLRRTKP